MSNLQNSIYLITFAFNNLDINFNNNNRNKKSKKKESTTTTTFWARARAVRIALSMTTLKKLVIAYYNLEMKDPEIESEIEFNNENDVFDALGTSTTTIYIHRVRDSELPLARSV